MTLRALLCSALAAAPLAAQVVRGPVLLPDSATRATGVIVVASDRSGAVVARSLTNELGEYVLRPPGAGSYVIRVLRIGFKPTVVPAIELAAGENRTLPIVLRGESVALSAVTVRGQKVCRIQQDSGQVVARLWEEAQKSLTATQLSSQDRTIQARWVNFVRTEDPSGDSVRTERSVAREAATDRPFISLAPSVLAQRGYVKKDPDGGMTFSAPDADALLSDQFAALHCFHVEQPPKNRADWIGIGFNPASERKDVSEIEGTLWLDRKTMELRLLEYKYTNLDFPLSEVGTGGFVEFAKLESGIWFVNRWAITMPHIRLETEPGRGQTFSTRDVMAGDRAHPVTDELRVNGGEVVSITRGTTEYRREGATLDFFVRAPDGAVGGLTVAVTGTDRTGKTDSTGHVRFEHLFPGRFRVRVTGPALAIAGAAALERFVQVREDAKIVSDSITLPSMMQLVESVCGRDVPGRNQSLIVGTVTSASGQPLARARMSISWLDDARKARNNLTVTDVSRELAATDSGSWQLCGVPRGRTLQARVMVNDRWADLGRIEVPDGKPLASFSLRLATGGPVASAPNGAVPSAGAAAAKVEPTGDLEGHVVATDSGSKRALAGAHIELPTTGRSATSDATGKFTLEDLPEGRLLIVVGKLGYKPESTHVTIFGSRVLVQEFRLSPPVTALAEVKVTGTASHPDMSGFEERRKQNGAGKFIDRATLANVENRSTGMVLSSLGGVRIWQGNNQAWASTTRIAVSGNLRATGLRQEDISAGARPACYMDVYLDGTIVYQFGVSPPMPLFNVNSIPPDQIEAMEVYNSSAQAPSRFNRTGSECGVLVIWSRR